MRRAVHEQHHQGVQVFLKLLVMFWHTILCRASSRFVTPFCSSPFLSHAFDVCRVPLAFVARTPLSIWLHPGPCTAECTKSFVAAANNNNNKMNQQQEQEQAKNVWCSSTWCLVFVGTRPSFLVLVNVLLQQAGR